MHGSLEAVEEAIFMVFTDLVSDAGPGPSKDRRKFFQCVSHRPCAEFDAPHPCWSDSYILRCWSPPCQAVRSSISVAGPGSTVDGTACNGLPVQLAPHKCTCAVCLSDDQSV